MVIVSVVASVMVFNALYPAIIQSNNAMIIMKSRLDDRLQSEVEIIHASGELDGNGAWQDVNGDGRFNSFIWVKNIGASRISALERMDVFYGFQKATLAASPTKTTLGAPSRTGPPPSKTTASGTPPPP